MKHYISNYQLRTNKKIKIKVAHLSDMHYHHTFDVKKFDTIVAEINKLKPNYICITGDLIDDKYVLDNKSDLEKFQVFLKKLNEVAQVIISLGNHEMKDITKKEYENYSSKDKKKIIDYLKEVRNIIILDNNIYTNSHITFIGYNPPCEYYKKKFRDNGLFVSDLNSKKFLLGNNYNILLLHTPKHLINKKVYNKINNAGKFDLVLSGHTHGGLMFKSKGNAGIISPEKGLFPRNVRGLIQKGNTNFIISYGITKLSYSSKIFRHFNFLYKMDIGNININ